LTATAAATATLPQVSVMSHMKAVKAEFAEAAFFIHWMLYLADFSCQCKIAKANIS